MIARNSERKMDGQAVEKKPVAKFPVRTHCVKALIHCINTKENTTVRL